MLHYKSWSVDFLAPMFSESHKLWNLLHVFIERFANFDLSYTYNLKSFPVPKIFNILNIGGKSHFSSKQKLVKVLAQLKRKFPKPSTNPWFTNLARPWRMVRCQPELQQEGLPLLPVVATKCLPPVSNIRIA